MLPFFKVYKVSTYLLDQLWGTFHEVVSNKNIVIRHKTEKNRYIISKLV